MTSADDIISEREKTHGDFSDFACVAQSFKDILHNHPNWASLTFVQKEGAEMVSNKLARILAGDPNFLDHWDDIGGYARLVAQRLLPMANPAVVNPNFSVRAGSADSEVEDAMTAAVAARFAPASASTSA